MDTELSMAERCKMSQGLMSQTHERFSHGLDARNHDPIAQARSAETPVPSPRPLDPPPQPAVEPPPEHTPPQPPIEIPPTDPSPSPARVPPQAIAIWRLRYT